MTEDATAASLAAITDALAHMQEQLAHVVGVSGRVEATQREILRRLDVVEAGQALIAQVAAHAHAAALGSGEPLPTEVADDPLLEQYLLAQPADLRSTSRALADWRRVTSNAGSDELAHLLARQYRPSPTDTPETRLLRYQLAAITREELRGRGVFPPTPPSSTMTADRSSEAAEARSAELAALWRAGESVALLGEPELAGALDLFEAAERRGRGGSEEQLSADLAALHRAIGASIKAGERPSTVDLGFQIDRDHISVVRPDQAR